MIDKKMTDKTRQIFNHDNVQIVVANGNTEIQCYWMRAPDGKIWIPYSGGPLYYEQAKDTSLWLARHINTFRSLLPKAIRNYTIVIGELDCRTFPGTFYKDPQFTARFTSQPN